MAASTILRVKRRKTENPSDVLVLSAKKRKADDCVDEGDNIKIMKLAVTVDVEDDPMKLKETVNKILAKKNAPNFEELKAKYKKSVSTKNSPMHKAKADAKETRQDSRYRLISQKRALKIDELEDWPGTKESEGSIMESNNEKESSRMFKLYDAVSESVEKEKVESKPEKISCNGVEMIREYVSSQKDSSAESEYGYVYDVYYSQAEGGHADFKDFDDSLLDGLVSIQPFNTGDDLVYDEYRDDPDEFKYEDDEDSNDEDNERNEYPDEDEDDSSYLGYCDDDDLDLEMRVKGLGFCGEDGSELSSDDEDQLLYTRSFDEDAAQHGNAYARYKQRIVREFYEDEDDDFDGSDDE